jgi:predicted naringenin-chalcone synthase
MSGAPRILGLGLANPERRYTQEALYAHNPWERTPLTDTLFLSSPVRERGLFVPPEWYQKPHSLTDTNRAWREGAMLLGGAALRDALERSDTRADQVDWLGVTSVTGYCTPGLDLLLARQEGLRHDLARAHFNCMGCHAAVPLLKVAADHAARRPGSRAVALAAEICSACFAQVPDPQNLVALSLFGDGAAAVVVSTEGAGPRIVDFASAFAFEHIDALGFDLTTEGFRIVLDPTIPDVIAAQVSGVVRSLLDRHGVGAHQVDLWALHPGGSRILDLAGAQLGLSEAQLAPSRRVLAQHGNMSSPSVLFVLAEALSEGMPPAGTYGVLAAFGPGLGIEVALLAFD